jgi:hypothetical protein
VSNLLFQHSNGLAERIYEVHMVRQLLEKFHWSAGVKFPVMTPLIKYVIKISNSMLKQEYWNKRENIL